VEQEEVAEPGAMEIMVGTEARVEREIRMAAMVVMVDAGGMAVTVDLAVMEEMEGTVLAFSSMMEH